jgi:hypothetical protein
MKGRLDVAPVSLKKTAKGFNSLGKTVFGYPILIQIAAAEVTLKNG